ncbi:MAG: ABC-F family ATP-binding cassette domain-containing protein [Clostridia bacterium]
MILLNADNLSLSYTDKALLEQINLTINDGEKIGVIGINGTGKSTLLKILGGEITPDSGKINRSQNLTISYLSQNPVFDENLTALQYVMTGFDAHKFPKEHEAKAVLNKLGVIEQDKPLSQLSGGQRRRSAIAKALIFPCELLILDEPTNHIDNDAAIYLEQYLKKYKGAIIMVTHDRYFLDRICNKILEIDKGDLYSYDTNYEGFLTLKAQREQMQIASERKKQSILRTELEWLRQGPTARGTKSRERIERIEKMQENTAPVADGKVEISSISSRLGKQILEIENISKSFDEKVLIRDFSYNLLRRDRIGIIGENGCGKSTLLKVLLGELEPDMGEIKTGKTVKIGYFSQEGESMNNDQLVIDYIKDHGEFVETKDGVITASKLLETFLFPANMQYTAIGRLSGGERRRLYLLSVLITAPNILFLDEPTNDLDITTLSILEDFLVDFDGAVVTVSHDRYFLDRVAEKLFIYEGEGVIRERVGSFSEYLIERDALASTAKEKKVSQPQKAKPKSQKLKLSFNEQREFDSIESEIEKLEHELELVDKDLTQNSSDYEKLEQLTAKKDEIEEKLLEKMERFEYLSDLDAKIKAQGK